MLQNKNLEQTKKFDIAMANYDGAKVCELVELLFLDELNELLGKSNFGNCRDDGLPMVKNPSGFQMDKLIKKVICYIKKMQSRYHS